MPFVETCRMEERIRMLSDYGSGNWSVTELCLRYGVSRDTFYEWRRRRDSGASDWFIDRSHAPLQCPHRTDPLLVETIVALRRKFPHMGPRKLRALLERQHPGSAWPAASTIGDLLKLAGLVTPIKRRRRPLDRRQPFAAVTAANDEWAIDFKGWFRTGDSTRVDPLTVTDSLSRFLLGVQIVPVTIEGARQALTAAFHSYGLPAAIRSDNGSPFGSNGAGGLTRLSVWWIKLGITPHFVHPASPQENGRHERMHRTLKQQTSQPPALTAPEQQARFDEFRWHYNHERPHEALDQVPPADLYTPSPRIMPDCLEDPWYDADHEVRRVRSSGEIIWHKQPVYVSLALVGELVGLAELETGDYVVRFMDRDIGLIDRLHTFRRFGPPRDNPETAPVPEPNQKLSTIIPVQNVDNQTG